MNYLVLLFVSGSSFIDSEWEDAYSAFERKKEIEDSGALVRVYVMKEISDDHS